MKVWFERFTWKIMGWLGLQPRMQPIPVRHEGTSPVRDRRSAR
ncbi:PA1414 family protein [Pseudomonas sp. LRF_L74]